VPTFAEHRSRRPDGLRRQPASSIVYIAFDYFRSSTLQDASLMSAFPPKTDKYQRVSVSPLCANRDRTVGFRGGQFDGDITNFSAFLELTGRHEGNSRRSQARWETRIEFASQPLRSFMGHFHPRSIALCRRVQKPTLQTGSPRARSLGLQGSVSLRTLYPRSKEGRQPGPPSPRPGRFSATSGCRPPSKPIAATASKRSASRSPAMQ
jgi:hypothetical protein